MYHISRRYIGHETWFWPTIPVSYNETERDMPQRVCASPTLEGCWLAICGMEVHRRMRTDTPSSFQYPIFFVYKFEDASEFVPNTLVSDFGQTDEHVAYRQQWGKLVEVFDVSKRVVDKASGFASRDILGNWDEAIEIATSEEYLEIIRAIERACDN